MTISTNNTININEAISFTATDNDATSNTNGRLVDLASSLQEAKANMRWWERVQGRDMRNGGDIFAHSRQADLAEEDLRTWERKEAAQKQVVKEAIERSKLEAQKCFKAYEAAITNWQDVWGWANPTLNSGDVHRSCWMSSRSVGLIEAYEAEEEAYNLLWEVRGY